MRTRLIDVLLATLLAASSLACAADYDKDADASVDPSLRGNLSFTYYPAGHMVYLNVDALKQFKSDLDAFYDRASSASEIPHKGRS